MRHAKPVNFIARKIFNQIYFLTIHILSCFPAHSVQQINANGTFQWIPYNKRYDATRQFIQLLSKQIQHCRCHRNSHYIAYQFCQKFRCFSNFTVFFFSLHFCCSFFSFDFIKKKLSFICIVARIFTQRVQFMEFQHFCDANYFSLILFFIAFRSAYFKSNFLIIASITFVHQFNYEIYCISIS